MIVVAVTLAMVAVASIYTYSVTPQYQSTARLFVTTQSTDTASDLNQGGLFSAQRVTSYADLAKSRELASAVARDLDIDVAPADLSGKVSASVVPDTVNLEISVTDPSAARAQALTQAYAGGLVDLVRQLETPTGQKTSPIKASIVDSATLPTAPVSPQPVRNLALGVVLGL